MQFRVAPEVFDAFPGLRIVGVAAAGLDNRTLRAGAAMAWRRAWRVAGIDYPYSNPQSHPQIRVWRARMLTLGVSGKKYPTSIEALLRRALKGGEPFSINPLVDFYNSVSLSRLVPAGGFDLGALGGELLELRRTRDGDSFLALDGEEEEEVPPGELAYACGSRVLTRHVVWRQSRWGAIGAETSRAVLLSEILGEQPEKLADRVAGDLAEGIERYFGVKAWQWRVEASRPEAVLAP